MHLHHAPARLRLFGDQLGRAIAPLQVVAAGEGADEHAFARDQRRHLAERIVPGDVGVISPHVGRRELDAVGHPDLIGEDEHLAHEWRGFRISQFHHGRPLPSAHQTCVLGSFNPYTPI